MAVGSIDVKLFEEVKIIDIHRKTQIFVIKLKEFELTWSWKSFENLSKEEVYEILSFRQSIFVVEQEFWYLDADALDQESLDLIVKYKDK